jgi:hypothetical protein
LASYLFTDGYNVFEGDTSGKYFGAERVANFVSDGFL